MRIPANAPAGAWFLVDKRGYVVAEIAKTEGVERLVALAPGKYWVKRRLADHLKIGEISVAAGETFRVRAPHNFLRIVPPTFNMATFLRIYSAAGQFVKEIPVRYRWDGTEYSAWSLLGFYDPARNDWNNSF